MRQGAQRVVQRHQGGGAGRVHRLGRAAQVEDVGEPVGQDRQGVAGHEIAVRPRRVGKPQLGIVGGGAADPDADRAPGQGAGGQAGILDGLGRDLQQQALLRVGLRGLARGQAEGPGVEAGDVAQMPGGEGIGAAGLALARVMEPGLGEPVFRQGGDGVTAFRHQAPEGIQVRGPGEAAGRPDDGNRDNLLLRFRCAILSRVF